MIDDTTFNEVSQMSHWLGGAFAVVGSTYLFGTEACWISAIVFSGCAALKEFWYDYKYEAVEVRGSSLEDFLFYELGVIIGISVVLLKTLL